MEVQVLLRNPNIKNLFCSLVALIEESVTCKSLLDSGSQVTTVAEWFYKQYLKDSDFIVVDELLDLQVNGQQLDYSNIILLLI